MTTIEDGVAELLANPLERTVHSQLVDRVLDECADPRRALLDIVLANRAADGPRLAFAQFCETTGDADRAEFIRVQCELAALSDRAAVVLYHKQQKENQRGCDPGMYGLCDHCNRIAREQELWVILRGKFLDSTLPQINSLGIEEYAIESVGSLRCGVVRRGFVSSLTCNAADFLRHADAILGDHPIEKVLLTRMPELDVIKVEKSRRWKTEPQPGELVLDLWRREWPGVEFDVLVPNVFHAEAV